MEKEKPPAPEWAQKLAFAVYSIILWPKPIQSSVTFLIICSFAIPIWFETTSVVRSNLPYSKINNLGRCEIEYTICKASNVKAEYIDELQSKMNQKFRGVTFRTGEDECDIRISRHSSPTIIKSLDNIKVHENMSANELVETLASYRFFETIPNFKTVEKETQVVITILSNKVIYDSNLIDKMTSQVAYNLNRVFNKLTRFEIKSEALLYHQGYKII